MAVGPDRHRAEAKAGPQGRPAGAEGLDACDAEPATGPTMLAVGSPAADCTAILHAPSPPDRLLLRTTPVGELREQFFLRHIPVVVEKPCRGCISTVDELDTVAGWQSQLAEPGVREVLGEEHERALSVVTREVAHD